jgi:hypothetical protein
MSNPAPSRSPGSGVSPVWLQLQFTLVVVFLVAVVVWIKLDTLHVQAMLSMLTQRSSALP